ncbi:DUF4382 domain-containing protein [Spongiibacter sp. KMU-166]|uniref:DUF4382 domain-containing protein n=1 Tax=Spongiibacter thalassae TaxID=2721624 RepID=A0ABX1GJN7_9GAMM|nr:DUF4382 domain-containing protein [Spongiibacter thalassae]NKI19457.1 DUF4382 domain-containing protein [Spongiibacter thalassae]
MKKLNDKLYAALLAGGGLLLLNGCGDDSNSSPAAKPEPGKISLFATDAPVDDVDAVKVTFSRIDLKPRDGDVIQIDLDAPVTIENLLELTGSTSQEIMGDVTVPSGEYNWIRLYVEGGFPDSTVTPEIGNETDLFIPGQQNGNSNGNPKSLKLTSGFTVAAGGESDFTIDFVLRKGLVKPANADYYLLRPALRLVDNQQVGAITGNVDGTVVNHPACAIYSGFGAVYLYEGDLVTAEQTPDDVYDPGIAAGSDEVDDSTTGPRPITTAEVKQREDGSYGYDIGFVSAGNYSVSYSCEAPNDAPESDDDIAFTETIAVNVVADATTNADFSEEPSEISGGAEADAGTGG